MLLEWLAGRPTALGFPSADTGGSRLARCVYHPLYMAIYVTAEESKVPRIRIAKSFTESKKT